MPRGTKRIGKGDNLIYAAPSQTTIDTREIQPSVSVCGYFMSKFFWQLLIVSKPAGSSHEGVVALSQCSIACPVTV